MTTFVELGLIEPLLAGIADAGYETPTPIQCRAIPAIFEGRDVLAAAQTGTGKTAGFALPMLQKLSQHKEPVAPGHVRALILVSTRELAAQIDENIEALGQHLNISRALIFGGVNIRPQTTRLKKGVDILVATPGRLLDHLSKKNINLSNVEMLVLDEADRMLDMGFIHDIKKILALVPSQRQSLLFSATFNKEIKDLAKTLLVDPISIEIESNKEATLISQSFYAIDKKRKRELLRDLIVDDDWQQVLVFTRMKYAANRLVQQLEKDGISAAAIHSNKSQNARMKALAAFKEHEVRVLVATDIAARGLDIEQLPHVVNYELPNVAEDYVHRIGRTGRAGTPGHAVSFVSSEDRPLLRDIEKLLKKKFDILVPQGYEGPQPDDIAQDDAKLDAARKRDLEKLRETKRRAPAKKTNDDKGFTRRTEFKGRAKRPTDSQEPLNTAIETANVESPLETREKAPRRNAYTKKRQTSRSDMGANDTARQTPKESSEQWDVSSQERTERVNNPRKPRTQSRTKTAGRGSFERSYSEGRRSNESRERQSQERSGRRGAPQRDNWDEDNFGNSIHYRPRRQNLRSLQSNQPMHWEPADPFHPKAQALSLPQTMPDEEWHSRRSDAHPTGNRRPRGAQQSNRPYRSGRSENSANIRSTVVRKESGSNFKRRRTKQ